MPSQPDEGLCTVAIEWAEDGPCETCGATKETHKLRVFNEFPYQPPIIKRCGRPDSDIVHHYELPFPTGVEAHLFEGGVKEAVE